MFGILFFTIGTGSNKADAVSLENMIKNDSLISAADKLSYKAALKYAKKCNLGGYSDWRIPTIKELYSIIDFSGFDPSGYKENNVSSLKPFIDTKYLKFSYGKEEDTERIIDSQYVTTSIYVSNSRMDFGVNFADGRIRGYGLDFMGSDKTFYVILVRGNKEYGINKFVDNGDNTISDNATGLMWSKDDSGLGMTWKEALKYAENSKLAAYSDWRLPNAKELQSIVDYSRSPDKTNSPAISELFNSTSILNELKQKDYPYIWSNTTHVNYMSKPGTAAAYVSFGSAMGYMSQKMGPPPTKGKMMNRPPRGERPEMDKNNTENATWSDVHGAGAQRSDPKEGNAKDYSKGRGPQGDAIRINNYVRLVRNI